MITKTSAQLSMGTKMGYAFGTFGECLAYNFFYLFFVYFLTDIVGMSPMTAGTISFIAVAWDGLTDPLIGYFSDHSKNSKGKRRPWIIRFCVPLGITTFLVYTSFDSLTGVYQTAYFLIMNILFWVFFTATDLPYITLGGEITADSNERVQIRGFATSFNYIGFGIAAAGTLLISSKFGDLLGSPEKGWSATAALFGVLVSLSFMVAYFATKGKEPIDVDNEYHVETVNIFTSLKESMTIRPFRNLLFYNFFIMTGVMLFTVASIYLFIYYLGANDAQIGVIWTIYAIMVVVISPLLAKVATKVGSKETLIFSAVLPTVAFIAYQFMPLTFVTIYGLLITVAISMAGFFVIGFAMVYDIAEVSELKTGFKNDGVLMSMYSFFMKLSTAVAMWLVGVLLEYYKYDPENIIPETLNGIRTMNALIPGLFCAVGIIFTVRYSLNKKNLATLKKVVEDKHNGIEVDADIVNKIL